MLNVENVLITICTIFVSPAGVGVGAIAVVETLHLGDIQGREDGVPGEGHTRVHGGHHPLGRVNGETMSVIFMPGLLNFGHKMLGC